MSVAALQETRWFGKNIYRVRSSVVLSALRDIPDAGQTRQRGEGVLSFIWKSSECVEGWRYSQWKAWSSRLVTASLVVGSGWLHVLSCYAPTFAVPREEDKFYDNLQAALSSFPSDECL